MRKIYITEAIAAGWYSFTCRPWFLLSLTLGLAVLFFLTSSHGAIVTALGCIVYAGFLSILIRHFNGEHVGYDDIFMYDGRWISFAFVSLIKWFCIFIGLLFFIVPGVYLMVHWMFAEVLVIDQNMRPLQALRASGEMTKGLMWQLLLFLLVVSLLLLLGLLAFVVGVMIAVLVVIFAHVRIYRDIKEGRS